MSNLDLKNKRVAILGLGIEGVALADFLEGKAESITLLDVLSADEILSKSDQKEEAKTLLNKYPLVSGDSYLDDLTNFDIIFRSPGISFDHPKLQKARESGVVISSQIKLFFNLCPCRIIGVTGTKGKGTTASLISEILKKSYQLPVTSYQYDADDKNSYTNNKQPITNNQTNVYLAGNIGYPAITLIPKLKPEDIVILELSSFQLMDLEKSPYIAVVTNLSVDHLDYHKDIEEYQNAKKSILKYQTDDDYAVLNKNSTFDESFVKSLRSGVKYFGSLDSRLRGNDGEESGNDREEMGNDREESGRDELDIVVENSSVVLDPSNRKIEICSIDKIKLFGKHNLENIAAATLVADILGININNIKQAITEFSGLPHRIELVKEIGGIKFINDSFATNPDPTMAVINSFKENKILILGGSSKGADFDELAENIVEKNVKATVLIGVERENIKKSLLKKNYTGQIINGGENIEDIVNHAHDLAESGDVVLFSPACASFDMFKNYKDRGDKFKIAVLNLSQNQKYKIKSQN